MWIFYTSLVLLALFTGYFFVFPLHKKRPVLIKNGGLIMYVVALALFLYAFLGIWVFVAAAVVVFFLFLFKPWFVYGVKKTMIFDALEKAALATRASVEKSTNDYRIDSSMKVRPYELIGEINIISFGIGRESKKARLTAIVFKKFIQNYFV